MEVVTSIHHSHQSKSLDNLVLIAFYSDGWKRWNQYLSVASPQL